MFYAITELLVKVLCSKSLMKSRFFVKDHFLFPPIFLKILPLPFGRNIGGLKTCLKSHFMVRQVHPEHCRRAHHERWICLNFDTNTLILHAFAGADSRRAQALALRDGRGRSLLAAATCLARVLTTAEASLWRSGVEG
jgi:hypothetical protein